jgi:hypothetical protein
MKELAVGRGLRIEGTELGQAALGETFAETGADGEQRQTAAAFTLLCLSRGTHEVFCGSM